MDVTNCLAIIPARGGSKRIPKKNIKDFNGKPIITYSINAALESGCFDEVMVSTDEKDIAKIAESKGAVVPFFRSKENSNDFAGLADVILEVLHLYEKENKFYKYCCCILPTAPFLTSDIIKRGFLKIKDASIDTVVSVLKFSYPIQRATVLKDGYLKMLWPENYNKRSQDLEDTYHDCGQFYWFKVDSFLKEKKLFSEKTYGLEISPLEAQDIDTMDDWELAELKFSLMNRR